MAERALSIFRSGIRLFFLWVYLIGLLGAGASSASGQKAVADTSGPTGTWYLNASRFALMATITESSPGAYQGTLVDENTGGVDPLNHISWDPSARRLEFRRGTRQWYRGFVVEGILVGRFSHSSQPVEQPPALTSYTYHVTGWNSTYLDRDIVPRVYEVLAHDTLRGRLRIDRSPDNPDRFIGRLKYYGTLTNKSNEELEFDLEVSRWDGTKLEFVRRGPATLQVYTGTAQGRRLSGVYTKAGTEELFPWTGVRAEALSYGLAGKSRDDRAAWQARTRQQLRHLLMNGDPAPLTREVRVLAESQPPISSIDLPSYRDDDPLNWPQNYRMTELAFEHTLSNPYGGSPLIRQAHGYLSMPGAGPPPGGRYPAVLALNGHSSSAYAIMDPASDWYGDAFARRGFVVLALDISHRPPSDRHDDAHGEGDDPAHGNGPHPSIKAPGFDSDWEEDGERAWDAQRGLDFLLSLPYVDPDRVLVTGLSMGGEVTTIAGALDLRFSLVLSAGYSTDLSLLTYNRHRCWQGLNSDLRDYVDMSDLQALIAPRPLIIETGKQDPVYSLRPDPFAADKQVTRRSRVAYGDDTGKFVHYLHYDVHHYHVGDVNPTQLTEQGVRVPLLIEPETPGSLTWQTDPSTTTDGSTLFGLIEAYLY